MRMVASMSRSHAASYSASGVTTASSRSRRCRCPRRPLRPASRSAWMESACSWRVRPTPPVQRRRRVTRTRLPCGGCRWLTAASRSLRRWTSTVPQRPRVRRCGAFDGAGNLFVTDSWLGEQAGPAAVLTAPLGRCGPVPARSRPRRRRPTGRHPSDPARARVKPSITTRAGRRSQFPELPVHSEHPELILRPILIEHQDVRDVRRLQLGAGRL